MKKETTPFKNKVWLASPTMHGDELEYMKEAFDTNWMSTVGENINVIEEKLAERAGVKYAAALSSGTSALHLAVRYAGQKLYGTDAIKPALGGHRVFCSDMTFCATVNPITYEGGEQVFIDSEYDTWNMDPEALEIAFEKYPDVKLVVLAHLYGTPAKLDEIMAICEEHGATLIEDAAESLGATYNGRETGSFGKYSIISFNGNKIITGSGGGMLLTDDEEAYNAVRKWSAQARDNAAWYQHSEPGYNYRMSNVVAGVVRGQLPYLSEHIAQKKAIYERYKEGFKELPVKMNPFTEEMAPNYWLSCMLIDEASMCEQIRTDLEASYVKEPGKTCPTEILEKLASINAEGRPIWKPMHMQPIYRGHVFVTAKEVNPDSEVKAVDEDIFRRGLCLPSDIKMTVEEQDKIIEMIKGCFR